MRYDARSTFEKLSWTHMNSGLMVRMAPGRQHCLDHAVEAAILSSNDNLKLRTLHSQWRKMNSSAATLQHDFKVSGEVRDRGGGLEAVCVIWTAGLLTD